MMPCANCALRHKKSKLNALGLSIKARDTQNACTRSGFRLFDSENARFVTGNLPTICAEEKSAEKDGIAEVLFL